jgi:peptidyl-prolyl cis-trans isomerase C
MTVVINRTHVAAPGKRIPIAVNGVVISGDEIAREIQNHPAEKPGDAWQAAARALVVRQLLLQEAARLELQADPQADEAGRFETGEEALIRALVEQEIATPEPDEENCRRYYAQNLARFRSPDIYEVSHILFAAPQNDPIAFAQCQLQAQTVVDKLELHPDRFEELAASFSGCPSAAQGGNLGQITPGQITPEFERALTTLEIGEISKAPVLTRYGVHIIRLNGKIAGRCLPFELVADKIAEYLRDNVGNRATAQYIARLVSRAEISGLHLEDAAAHRVS